MPREKQHTVNLKEADKLKLEKLSMRRKISQTELLGYYIQIDDEKDIYSADWETRLDDAHEKHARDTALKGACSRLSFDDPFYICIVDQVEDHPKISKLAKSKNATLDICDRCPTDTRKEALRKAGMKRIRGLRIELHQTAPTEFMKPYCGYEENLGDASSLTDDGLSFSECRVKSRSKPKSAHIENYCKVRMDGEPCGFYGEKLIGILWGKADGRRIESKVKYPRVFGF